MRLKHQTSVDPLAVHQVRFIASAGGIAVSCNCRVRAPESNNSVDGSRLHDPIGLSRNLDESRRLYNDPANHWAPFDPVKDKAKW